MMIQSALRSAGRHIVRKQQQLATAAATTTTSNTKTTQFLVRRSLQSYAPSFDDRSDKVRGPGGRASETGCKVAVFGASGFLGNYVCYELGSNGFIGYLGNRGDELEMRHLKPYFELGRTRYVFYSPRDIDSIQDVIADADVVVNMIGKFYETNELVQTDKFPYVKMRPNYSFEETNVTIAQRIAEICKDMQVDHLIHVSSAAASPDSSSEWARTKYEGECAVKEAYPWATIVRPTQLFGREDRLLNWFSTMGIMYQMIPLIDDGDALTQPVWVADVAKTMLKIINEPHLYEGRTVDCFGPNDITYKELAEFSNEISERNRKIVHIPKPVFQTLSKVLQWNRIGSVKPMVVPDLIDLWSEDYLPELKTQEGYDQQTDTDGSQKILTMKDLGIEAKAIEKVAFSYMHRYRFGGHFHRVDSYH